MSKKKEFPEGVSWLEEQAVSIKENDLNNSHCMNLIKNYTKRIEIVEEQNRLYANKALKFIETYEDKYKIPIKYKLFFKKKLQG